MHNPVEHVRAAMGMNQKDFGVFLGYSASGAQALISNFESGKKPIPLQLLFTLMLINDVIRARGEAAGRSMLLVLREEAEKLVRKE